MVRGVSGRGKGWGRRECCRLQELQQVQRPVVGSTMVRSRTRKKVSVVRGWFSKRLLSTCLCVGPCAEYEEHKGEWIDFCKPGAHNLVDARVDKYSQHGDYSNGESRAIRAQRRHLTQSVGCKRLPGGGDN